MATLSVPVKYSRGIASCHTISPSITTPTIAAGHQTPPLPSKRASNGSRPRPAKRRRARATCPRAWSGRHAGGALAHRRRSPRMLSRNDEKKIWIPTIISEAAITARCSSASEPKPCEIHVDEDHAPDDDADEHEHAAQQQAVLEAKARAHAVEPRVVLAHEVRAVRVRAQAQRQHLRADDHQQRAADQRVHAPRAAEEVKPAPTNTHDHGARARPARRRAR